MLLRKSQNLSYYYAEQEYIIKRFSNVTFVLSWHQNCIWSRFELIHQNCVTKTIY